MAKKSNTPGPVRRRDHPGNGRTLSTHDVDLAWCPSRRSGRLVELPGFCADLRVPTRMFLDASIEPALSRSGGCFRSVWTFMVARCASMEAVGLRPADVHGVASLHLGVGGGGSLVGTAEAKELGDGDSRCVVLGGQFSAWDVVVHQPCRHGCRGIRWSSAACSSAVSCVAGYEAEFEFVGDGASGLLVRRVVVVFEELATAAVDALAVAFLDQALLSGGGMSAAVADIDRSGLGSWMRARRKAVGAKRSTRCRGWGAVVEGAAVASDVEYEFGGDLAGALREDGVEGVGLLLGEGGPGAIRCAARGRAHDDGGRMAVRRPARWG